MRQINIFAVFMPIIEMLGITAIAIVIYVGGGHVLHQSVSIGVLAAFLAYMKCFSAPSVTWRKSITSCKTPWPRPNGSSCSWTPGPCHGSAGPKHCPVPWKRSALNRVPGLQPGEAVLKSIDLTIDAGETIAIVGATGSGKTSLVNLLVRFYDPTAGSMQLQRHRLCEIPPEELRKRIALVMQDPFPVHRVIESEHFFGATAFRRSAGEYP
jgi:ATP-binding cassette subfamily B multidrug efflux pump